MRTPSYSSLKLLCTPLLLLLLSPVASFVPPKPPAAFGVVDVGTASGQPQSAGTTTTQTTALHVLPSVVEDIIMTTTTISSSNSLWIATVDSDIAKLSDNEFAPIFMGGILVMLGGLLSAVVVGMIVDKKDLYANIVADSYMQAGSDDEEFWKGLSDEEKRKTQEMLQNLKKRSNSNTQEPPPAVVAPDLLVKASNTASSSSGSTPSVETRKAKVLPSPRLVAASKEEEKKMSEIGMFSDYGDDS